MDYWTENPTATVEHTGEDGEAQQVNDAELCFTHGSINPLVKTIIG